jgi:hypothetical protein
MTFRRLTNEELAPLEKKFIQFLVSHTITGDDWAKMKERRPEQAMGLVDIFSDLMFEEAMKKVQFLQYAEPKALKIFYCKENEIELLGLIASENNTIDFTKEEKWFKDIQNTVEEQNAPRVLGVGKGDVSTFKTEKNIPKPAKLKFSK